MQFSHGRAQRLIAWKKYSCERAAASDGWGDVWEAGSLTAAALTHSPGAARRVQTELMNCGCGGDNRGAPHGNQCLSGLNPKKALISPSSCRGGDSSRVAAQTQVRRRRAGESEARTKAYVCILYNEVHFELNQATLLKKKNTLYSVTFVSLENTSLDVPAFDFMSRACVDVAAVQLLTHV